MEPMPARPSPATGPAPPRAASAIVLVLLDDAGNTVQRFQRPGPDTTIGRLDGDIRFTEDVFLSPLHAKVSWENGALVGRDLGSRNGTWACLEGPHRHDDGDLLLIGSQATRLRRPGAPAPHPPPAAAARPMRSLRAAAH